MTIEKIKMISKEISKKTNIPFNKIFHNCFLELILRKISKSKYSNFFVLKGGYLITTIFNYKWRTTVDLDFMSIFKNKNLGEIKDIVNKILNEKDENDTIYKIYKTEPINVNNEKKGIRLYVKVKIKNITEIVPLDIVEESKIDPTYISKEFNSIYGENFTFLIYNIENVIAEKVFAIYTNRFWNSRLKDFFDIYYLFENQKKFINKEILKKAIDNAFKVRNASFDKTIFIDLLNALKISELQNLQWEKLVLSKNWQTSKSFGEIVEVIIKHFENDIENV